MPDGWPLASRRVGGRVESDRIAFAAWLPQLEHHMSKMMQARAEKFLDTRVLTEQFGVVTRREKLDRRREAGYVVRIVSIPDHAAREAAERRAHTMMRADNGWGVPTGNPRHPRTIEYNALLKTAKTAMVDEYRHEHPVGGTYYLLSTFEYQYLTRTAASTPPSAGPTAV